MGTYPSVTPAVSVVIAAFNVAAYILDAVESVLAQTVSNIEVSVVDDGSVDGTAERLEGLNDPRLQILRQSNSGQASSQNVGIRASCGEFIAFLDGDDLWLPDKLEHHLDSFAVHPEADITYSLSKTIDNHGREIRFVMPRCGGPVSYRELLLENVVRNGSAAVARRRVFNETGLFDPHLVASADLDMWLRIAVLRTGNIVCIPKCLTLYRQREGQESADWHLMQTGWFQVLTKARKRSPELVRKLESQANSDRHAYFSRLAYDGGDYGAAFELLWQSVKFSPSGALFRIRLWLLATACIVGAVLPGRVHRRLVDGGLRCARLVSHGLLLGYRRFGNRTP
jgi:glycosyltransferase involved in cell wall biosynthesis